MSVLQPAKSQQHPRQPVGVFTCAIAAACLLLGVGLGVGLRGLNTSSTNSTHWQDKAAASVQTPVTVTYKKPTTYTTPEAIALKAEMDALKRNFNRYKQARVAINQQIYGGAAEATTPALAPEKPSTAALAAKITRTLLLDEVDSFFNKVQLVEEVRAHVVDEAAEVGF